MLCRPSPSSVGVLLVKWGWGESGHPQKTDMTLPSPCSPAEGRESHLAHAAGTNPRAAEGGRGLTALSLPVGNMLVSHHGFFSREVYLI